MTTHRYEVAHNTHYEYDAPKHSSVMYLCVKPRTTDSQHVESFELATIPESKIDEDSDSFGNTRNCFDIHRPHKQLSITSHAIVSVESSSSIHSLKGSAWENLKGLESSMEMWHYLQPTDLTKTKHDLDQWIRSQGGIDEETPFTFLYAVERMLSNVITYKPGSTTIESTVDDLLTHHEGVCQDISQLMIAIARSRGIPARYVSGYLYVEPNETRRVVDNATHAWVECFFPGHGWISFDPTNPDSASESHIMIAYGRDYRDVAPTKGITLGLGDTIMDVSVSVNPYFQQYQSLQSTLT